MNSAHEQAACEERSTFHNINRDNDAPIKRWHYHDQFELHYFRSFSGVALVGDYVGRLSPDSLFLLAPGVPHSWTGDVSQQGSGDFCSADYRPVAVMNLVTEAIILRAIDVLPELRAIEEMMQDAQFGIEFKNCPEMAGIGELMLGMTSLQGCAKLSQFFLLLDKLTRCQYQALSSVRLFNGKEPCVNEGLGHSMSYINEHFRENVTLEIVSQISNMSTAYFCRVFKKTYGVGFLDYINGLRVRHACKCLRETDDPISSIGYESGFPNISNFNRNFRKFMRNTPSVYRGEG